MGGFRALRDVLADDYEIGRRLIACGYRVALSGCVVETLASEVAPKELLLHELRWARTIRAVRPIGFAGMCVTFTISMCVLAALLLAGAGTVAPVAMVTAGLLARLVLHLDVASRFAVSRDPVWLLPIRDALSLGIWAASFIGRRVSWRGQRFSVRQDGSLIESESMGPS